MLSFLMAVLIMYWFGKLLIWGFKATWTIGKVVFSIVLFPIMIGVLITAGLFYMIIVVAIVAAVILAIKYFTEN